MNSHCLCFDKQNKFVLSLLETKYSFVGKHIYIWNKSKIENI